MTKDQMRIRDEAIVAFDKALPDMSTWEVIALVDALRKLGRAAEKNAENLCNLAIYKDRRDSIRGRVQKVLDAYGVGHIKYKVGGDPRGYCLKIMLPNGAYNTWGGAEEGWGL